MPKLLTSSVEVILLRKFINFRGSIASGFYGSRGNVVATEAMKFPWKSVNAHTIRAFMEAGCNFGLRLGLGTIWGQGEGWGRG